MRSEDDDDDDDDDVGPSTGIVQNPVPAATQQIAQPAVANVVDETASAADYPVGDTEGSTIYDEDVNNIGVEVDNIQNGIDLAQNDVALKDPSNDNVAAASIQAAQQQVSIASAASDDDDDEDDDDDDVGDIEDALDDDDDDGKWFVHAKRCHTIRKM